MQRTLKKIDFLLKYLTTEFGYNIFLKFIARLKEGFVKTDSCFSTAQNLSS